LLLHNLGHFTRHYRSTAKREVAREVSLDDGPSSAEWAEQLVAGTPPPCSEALREERARTVHQALGRLPEDYRQILLWRYQDELRLEETARRLGRSANAARKLWARALERLQEELGTPP